MKALILAAREYVAIVRTKAFVLGLVFAPTLLAISLLFIPRDRGPEEGGAREVALIDHSGRIAEALARAGAEAGIHVRAHAPEQVDPERRAELERAVKAGSLAAVLVVKEGALDPASRAPAAELTIRNVAGGTAAWLRDTLTARIELERLLAEGVARERAELLLTPPSIEVRLPDGGGSGQRALIEAALVPFLTLMIVFMAVLSSAPYLLHSVVEEKQQRIAEVLLGSMSPFDIMLGKLMGSAGAALTVLFVYAGAGAAAAASYGVGSALSPSLLLLSLIDVLVALVMYGSLFLAAGAAATEQKEAQALMTPVLMLVFLPMLVLSRLVSSPDGQLALTLTFFPFTAPLVLPFRLATTNVPAWQVALSLAGATLTTCGIVWVAGRIFRIGILAQGRAPRLTELWRWIRSA